MKTDIVGLAAVMVAAFLGYSYLKQKDSITSTQQKLAMTGLTPEQAAAISTAQGNAIGAQAGLAQNSAAVAVSTAAPGSNAPVPIGPVGIPSAFYTKPPVVGSTIPAYNPPAFTNPDKPPTVGTPSIASNPTQAINPNKPPTLAQATTTDGLTWTAV